MLKTIAGLFKRHYFNRYHGIYRQAKKLFIFDLALLATSIFLLFTSLFFLFWQPTITDLIDINFSINTEGRLLNGQEVTISIECFNRSKHFLEETVLAAHLPKGFVLMQQTDNKLQLEENFTKNLGRLAPGARETITVTGLIYSEMNVDEKITAYLSYRPEDKKTKEQKISAFLLKTVDSVLSAELNMAKVSISHNNLPITITLKNTGNYDLHHISFNQEKSFLLQNYTKELNDFSLSAGETKVFVGTIKTPSEEGEHNLNFVFDIFINNHQIPIQNIKKTLSIIKPTIATGVRSEFKNNYADGGDIVPIRVYWHNPGNFELQNIKLKIITTPGIVNLNATALDNRLKIENNQLIADKSTRTALAKALANASDEFTINLKLQPFFKTENQNQLEIRIVAEAEIPEIHEQKLIYESIETIRLPLATQLNWQVKPVYYTDSGDQLGRGPLPPEVNQATKYWVFVEMENGINSLSNNNFKAILGDNITFTGKQSVSIGQEIKYDKAQNILTWNQPNIPALGKFGLYFELESTPVASQVGEKITLMKNLSLSAEDSVTGKKINLYHNTLINQLTKNDKGSLFSPIVRY